MKSISIRILNICLSEFHSLDQHTKLAHVEIDISRPTEYLLLIKMDCQQGRFFLMVFKPWGWKHNLEVS